jgi:hypothetical protein
MKVRDRAGCNLSRLRDFYAQAAHAHGAETHRSRG